MRIVFYDCGYETFGVQYLLSVLKKFSHEVYLFFDSSFSKDYLAQDFFLKDFFSLTPQEVCNNILAYSPEVVCFSLYTIFYQENIAAIRLLKKARPDVIIICGGFHASLLPDLVLENEEIDFVVIGEAENSLPALLAALASSDKEEVKALSEDALAGIWNIYDGRVVERGLSSICHNLDSLPFPEKEMYYKINPSLAQIYTIIASRGCPYDCTYCNSAVMNKVYLQQHETYYRIRSVENVIAELKVAREKFKPRYIMFFDDCFAARRDWLREFSQRYKKEIGLPYYCQTNPLIHDEESLRLLAESGCVLLEFGFQSANEEVRRDILNRKENNREVKSLVLNAIKLGMFTELDLIVNLPSETNAHLQEALNFVSETRPHWVNLAFLQFHPKTHIINIAISKKMLEEKDKIRIEQGEYAFSMRLLEKSGLDQRYRVLVFEMFFASRFPNKISKILIRILQKPLIRQACSCIASIFLYTSRVLLSYTDKRDFLIRNHVIRSLHAAKWVITRKVLSYAR